MRIWVFCGFRQLAMFPLWSATHLWPLLMGGFLLHPESEPCGEGGLKFLGVVHICRRFEKLHPSYWKNRSVCSECPKAAHLLFKVTLRAQLGDMKTYPAMCLAVLVLWFDLPKIPASYPARLAQSAARRSHNPKVMSSILIPRSCFMSHVL